jgi:hypothetical protein
MLPTSGEISMNDIEYELYGTTGSVDVLGTLLDAFNTYSTNAYHSAHSFNNAYGFRSENLWHFIDVYAATDNSTYMAITLKNFAQVDSQSGTFVWLIKDEYDTVLGSGSDYIAAIENGISILNCYYSGGTPYKITYHWSASLGYQEYIF